MEKQNIYGENRKNEWIKLERFKKKIREREQREGVKNGGKE